LNSYTSRQRLLRPSCLPFHHLGLSTGSIGFRNAPLSNVAPFHGCSFSGVWLPPVAHLPFHHLGPQPTWCSRWDLNPHTHRAYASETYVSTIPPPEHFSTNFHVLYVYPSPFCFGGMAPNTSLRSVWIAHLPFHYSFEMSRL
jgi:hypothetical protein